jgi:hypothetical protein
MEHVAMTFASSDREIRVNFGVLSGREATAAEIEELARELHTRLPSFTVVSEQRYQFGEDVEASVHQVRIEAEEPLDDELRGRILEIADRWASACAAERHLELEPAEPSPLDPVA